MARRRVDVSAFAGVPLFDGHDRRSLALLAPHADRLVLAPGAHVALEGRRHHEVVVVVAGEVVVTRDGREVGRLGPGAVIGGREEVDGSAHTVGCRAGDRVEVLVLTGPAFRWAQQALVGFAPDLAPRPEPAEVRAIGAVA
jgi:CRP-like cAMP-binding protein